MSLASQLAAAKAKTAAAKAIKDGSGVPLGGQDLTDFTNDINAAKNAADDAMLDPDYSGLTGTALPTGGGATPYTDACAARSAEAETLYTEDENKQRQIDCLKTVSECADDAITEVS